MSYKIKISCTHTDELSFKGKNIKKTINQKISNMVKEVSYVNRIVLVTRIILTKRKNNIKKSLEFYCDDKLDKNGLIELIDKIKQFGFESEKNTKVEFIEVETNTRVHVMGFDGKDFLQIDKFVGKRRPSRYSTLVIYNK